MIRPALYPYYAQFLLDLNKRYRMSEFIRNSVDTLERTADALIKKIPRGTSIGVFGTYDSAQVIHLRLRRAGHKRICFIKSGHMMEELCYSPIIDSGYEQIADLDCIFTSSLASSAAQKKYLLEQGYKGRIICLPDLKHLGITLIRDFATYERVQEMEGRHAGKSAFIIGTAPSLKETDPRKIGSQFVTFAGNGIVNLDDFYPDYYFAIDQSAIVMWKEKIERLNSKLVFPSNLRRVISWELPEKVYDSVFFPLCYEQQDNLNVQAWSSLGFESGHTVICPMLQFALLLGCTTIYIIGVDISYSSENQNYFSPKYHRAGTSNYSTSQTISINSRMHQSIERVTSACAKAGIKVFNCSPTNNMPYIDYSPFDSALNSL